MKTKFRGLALTAMLLSSTSMTFAQQGASSAVGDLPGYGEEAYFDEDAAYAVSDEVVPASHVQATTARYAPSQPARVAIATVPNGSVSTTAIRPGRSFTASNRILHARRLRRKL